MITLELKTKFDHLPQLSEQVREMVSQVVKKTALDFEGEVKKEMALPKSGRKYRTHVASAPGEAPAVDLGQLINSIQIEHLNDYTSVIGTNVEYAVYLEYGTRRMAARPVWRPTIEKLREPFTEALTQVLKRLN